MMAVDRPYRAVWSSTGLQTDGWTIPGRPASIRVFGRSGSAPGVERVKITLRAPASSPARYRLVTETADRLGAVAAGAATDEIVLVCVAPGAPADVTITSLDRRGRSMGRRSGRRSDRGGRRRPRGDQGRGDGQRDR